MAHLTIVAGAVDRGDPFEHPLGNDAQPLRAGLLKTKRVEALSFGRTRWAGHEGVLFLAPPYLFGGQLGNHLCFRWRQNGTDYLISLHSWEPLPDTAATLRAIVVSALRD
jgi:hypothetical protein